MNWKELQRFDAKNCGLVTNADRMAQPNWPDGITLKMAMEHLDIDADITPTGWLPESKYGYLYLKKELYEIITVNKKTVNTVLLYKYKRWLYTRKANFYSVINNPKPSQVFVKEVVDKKFKPTKFLTDSLEQAHGYLSVNGIDPVLQYPFVAWHPKNRLGERKRYEDGIVFMTYSTLLAWLKSQ